MTPREELLALDLERLEHDERVKAIERYREQTGRGASSTPVRSHIDSWVLDYVWAHPGVSTPDLLVAYTRELGADVPRSNMHNSTGRLMRQKAIYCVRMMVHRGAGRMAWFYGEQPKLLKPAPAGI